VGKYWVQCVFAWESCCDAVGCVWESGQEVRGDREKRKGRVEISGLGGVEWRRRVEWLIDCLGLRELVCFLAKSILNGRSCFKARILNRCSTNSPNLDGLLDGFMGKL
jgi:hypothetical protein